MPSAGRGHIGQRRPTSLPAPGGLAVSSPIPLGNVSRSFDYSDGVTGKPEVGRLHSAVAMSSLTVLELPVGASGPTRGASFSILKA
jgi:hypothetical protein